MRIGIISAMALELEFVLSKVNVIEAKEMRGVPIYYASFANDELVLMTCGVGKVNAAIFTQMLLDHEDVELIINVGIAGGLMDVFPLDIVLGSSYCHHDVRLEQMSALFPFQNVFEPRQPLLEQVVKASGFNVKTGRISSGENFISDNEEREYVRRSFQANIVDMETSAIAHCCYVNDVDFFALRCVSDLADDNASESYEKNERGAADKAGKALMGILKNLKIK